MRLEMAPRISSGGSELARSSAIDLKVAGSPKAKVAPRPLQAEADTNLLWGVGVGSGWEEGAGEDSSNFLGSPIGGKWVWRVDYDVSGL